MMRKGISAKLTESHRDVLVVDVQDYIVFESNKFYHFRLYNWNNSNLNNNRTGLEDLPSLATGKGDAMTEIVEREDNKWYTSIINNNLIYSILEHSVEISVNLCFEAALI